jgi:hypothetical protein
MVSEIRKAQQWHDQTEAAMRQIPMIDKIYFRHMQQPFLQILNFSLNHILLEALVYLLLVFQQCFLKILN